MAIVAQLVRASDCGSESRGFESRQSPILFLTPTFSMTILEALILGIIQGLTEFLPVSSSGHLMLMQVLLGMKNLRGLILFDLVCHLGTLLAIFYFFRQQIANVFSTHGKLFFLICLGTVPLFFMVPFKTWIDYAFSSPTWLW